MKTFETDVCIVGAGPAGMILGLLLAKMGRQVLVLEHHEDFYREYRGEVLMPRFTQMARQIGIFEHLEKYPHLKLNEMEGFYQNHRVLRISFQEIAPEAPFAIWMPQPVMLQALWDQAKNYPSFSLWFGTRVENLIWEGEKCVGVLANKDEEKIEIKSKVTVGADGRFSVVRKRGHFELEEEDYYFDIVWFTIPKPPGYDNHVRFFLSPERNLLVLPKYPDLVQCGLVVPKGEFVHFMKQGIDSLKQVLLKCPPIVHDFARGLKDFSPFNVLQANIEYVKRWAKDGVILVGDSAHTCSPAGAIGVSVAVATAIVAADVIEDCFQKGDFSAAALNKVQKIRSKEVRHIQKMQRAFTRILLPKSPWMRKLTPLFLFVSARLGLFRFFQRDLMVMREPLPIRKELNFK